MPPSDGDRAATDSATADSQRHGTAPSVGDDPADTLEVDTEAVDPVLFRTFWGSVIAVNVAMTAVPLGVLLIHFRGDWELGGLAIAVGAVAAVGALRFYLIFRADRRDDEEATTP